MRRTVLALAIVSALSLPGCASNSYYYQPNTGTGQRGSFCTGDANSLCLLGIVGVLFGVGAAVAASN